MDSLCRVRNKIMYVLSWRTVSVHTRVLFWYFFPSLLRNSGNKHQNNPVVSAETVRHSSTYIILYIMSYIGPSAVVSEAFSILIPDICHTITDRMHWFVACFLTHWGRDNMAAISLTTLSNAFSWMKMLEFRLKFHWSLLPRVQSTIFQHWFR